MKKNWIIGLGCLLLLVAFRLPRQIIFSVPENWPAPSYDFSKNPLNAETIELGRALFYDPLLSLDSSISCNSCHSQYSGFTHVDHKLSHGIGDRIGTRNSPVLINLAWNKSFMWDGAVNHLDVQALAPISHPDEMNENINGVIIKLRRSSLYPGLFRLAFGDTSITGEKVLKAISQFMLTLVSSNSKYDSVMRGESRFTIQEANGYELFKKNCNSCHSEPLFTNLGFENNGLKPDSTLNDQGRFKVTNNPSDKFKFKVPTLRNIEFSYPYMHDGRFVKLSQVIDHYVMGFSNEGIRPPALSTPVVLSSNEKVDLIAFLLTLSDRGFLFDPQFSYPRKIFNK